MTVKLFGLEFADEAARDCALRELKQSLDRITQAENQAMSGWDASGLSPIFTRPSVERKCQHGYGINEGPCPTCDSPGDVVVSEDHMCTLAEILVKAGANPCEVCELWKFERE